MLILAIETTSQKGSVALCRDQEVLAYAAHSEPNQHAERMLSLIEAVHEEAQLARTAVELLAVGVGPGAFTGIRVGLSIASGYALALGVPITGVSSLASIAANAPVADARPRLVLRDARREEFFLAVYGADGEALLSDRAVRLDQLSTHLEELEATAGSSWASRGVLVLGEDAASVRAELDVVLKDRWEFAHSECLEPDARSSARLALSLPQLERPPAPVYLRGANAKRPDLPVSPLQMPRK